MKFLVRYEVAGCENQGAQFRYKRIEMNLMVRDLFNLQPSFHLSKKFSDLYNTQIETVITDLRVQEMVGKPKITEIKIVQPHSKAWSLKKKEGQAQFFELFKDNPELQEQSLTFSFANVPSLPERLADVIAA